MERYDLDHIRDEFEYLLQHLSLADLCADTALFWQLENIKALLNMEPDELLCSTDQEDGE